MREVADLTGMVFGKWTVIKRADDYISPKGRRKATWTCRCECGNIKDVVGELLKSGHSKSCGCLNKEMLSNRGYDLTGKIFGRLMVIQQINNSIRENGRSYRQWECLCECGNTIIATTQCLTKGKTKSCGCLNNEKRHERTPNKCKDMGKYVVMYNNDGREIYVDKEDYPLVSPYCWRIIKTGYVIANINRRTVYLHRFIMGEPDGYLVDHWGGDKTRNDNRRYNLRIATYLENTLNRKPNKTSETGVAGVTWYKTSNKWKAAITVNKKYMVLGYFENFDDAVKSRKEAEEKYFGEWSYDNSQKNAKKKLLDYNNNQTGTEETVV